MNKIIEELKLAIDLIKSGDFIKAEGILLRIIKNKSNEYNSLHLLGYIYTRKGNIIEGIELIKKSLSFFPNFPEALMNLGDSYLLIKDYDEAIINYEKAIKLKENPNFYTNLGNAYSEKTDNENAIKAYERGIFLGSNDPKVYNNLGIIKKRQGKKIEAKNHYIKALSIKPNLVDAKINLNNIMNEEVPRWHIGMMNDTYRNDAFLEAIKKVVKKDDFVFEIGTGSGLLSMMSIDQGAKKVITCETIETISQVAEKIIKKNNYENKITVINKHSKDINIGLDIPNKADVIISEILSSEFLGEGVLASLSDAKKRLLKDGGKIIPESGGIMIALLGESKMIKEKIYVEKVAGYDLSEFNFVIGRKQGIYPKEGDINVISESEESFKFNFYDEFFNNKTADIALVANKSETCYGIITWNKINLSKDIIYENKPFESESHWMNPVYLFDKPIEIKEGEKILIEGVIEGDRIWFNMKEN